MKLGLDGVSDHTVTYHYCTPAEMERLAKALEADPESIGIQDAREKRKAEGPPLSMGPISPTWRPPGTGQDWLGPAEEKA